MKKTAEEHFKNWLVKGEIISYSEYKDKITIPRKKQNLTIIIFFVIFWISIILQPLFAIALLISIPIFLKYTSLFKHWDLDSLENPQPPFYTFAITDKRIILLNLEHKITSIPYRNIYNFINRENALEIVIDPFIDSSIFKISSKSSLRKVNDHLLKVWENKSPYALINKRIQLFADKYELECKPFVFGGNNILSLNGKIEESIFSFELKYMLDFKIMKVTILCNNEENNYLSLYKETIIDQFPKLNPSYDYKIGIEWFDSDFIIKTDNNKFIKNILQEEVAVKISQAMTNLKGKLIMGIPKKAAKKQTNRQNDNITLDAHLITEQESKLERIKNNQSELIFTTNELRYNDDFEEIGKDIVLTLEMLVSLAQRINAYDGKNS